MRPVVGNFPTIIIIVNKSFQRATTVSGFLRRLFSYPVPREEQKYFTRRRKASKAIFLGGPCALAAWREIVCFYVPSCAMGYDLPSALGAGGGANRPFDDIGNWPARATVSYP